MSYGKNLLSGLTSSAQTNSPLNSVYNINTQTYHPLQGQSQQQIHNQMMAARNQYQLSQAQSQQQLYNQMMSARNQFKPARWMLDGEAMTFKEFCDAIYPDDCAEKTHLILKFGGKEDDN
jgi:hypothetical protein